MADDVKAQYGLVASSFDILHPGYLRLFKQAKEHCETLVVFLHVDPSVERPEKNKPILSLEERILALESNRYVDKIIPYDTEQDLLGYLKGYTGGDAVRFLGDDYKQATNFTGKELEIPIVWISRDHGWSLTLLREKIIAVNKQKKNLLAQSAQKQLLEIMASIAKQNQKMFDVKFSRQLYSAISADPVFDLVNDKLLISNKNLMELIKLHGLAEGWWLPVSNDKNMFLSFGEWQLYYTLVTGTEGV